MVGQLQEEEKRLGLAPLWTDCKASTGKPFPSPAHPSLCLSWQQTSRLSYTQISRNKAQKFSLLAGICSPAQRVTVSAVRAADSGTDRIVSQGRHGMRSHRVRWPASASLGTAAPRSQTTSAHPRARIQIKASPSWNQAITQARKLGAMFVSLLKVAMTTTSSFKRWTGRGHEALVMPGVIKYHTSREYRRLSSSGCHLQLKKTNTLRWQTHPPQNSQASRHSHSKPFQHYQRANLQRISLLKKYLYLSTLHHAIN